MILALLLALQAIGSEVMIAPGGVAEMPVLLRTDTPVRFASTGVVETDYVIDVPPNGAVDVQLRTSPRTTPGTYETYVYVIPESDDAVVAGTAMPLTVVVTEISSEQTNHTLPKSYWPYWIVALILGALVVIATSVRIKKT